MASDPQDIKQEPAVEKLLSRMPERIANSFSAEQLIHLKTAIGSREWGKHKVDFRGTFPIPFFKSRIYYVFLMGRNHRNLTRKEQVISALTVAGFITLFVIFSILFGLLALYLLKSALGINLFENFSLGIWTWFKLLWT